MPTNETHDPSTRSWIESANDPATDFPIQNLPFCVYETEDETITAGLAIGEFVLEIEALGPELLKGTALEAMFEPPGHSPSLGSYNAAFWADHIGEIRRRAWSLLREDSAPLRDDQERRARAFKRIDSVRFNPRNDIGNYTDFYASIHHAATVGSMFRPDSPLLPNYKWVPIGYHGRASSIVPSGTPIRRPRGQQSPPEGDPKAAPAFGPCKMLDYELEVGCIVGRGTALGQPVGIRDIERHIFGLCLVNDWSARDIQRWEYQPLGPFLAKNFGTSVSPFIVTLDALEPFRCPAYKRPSDDPKPVPYLFSETDQSRGGFDLTLEVYLESEQMRARGMAPVLLSRSKAFREMYWTFAQMLTHHCSNGCNLQPGDLLASGTVSGPGPSERGCMLELTWQGNGPDGKPLPRKPIQLPTGEARTFLADGDELILKGYCERDGFRRIGFGECRGRIAAAD